MRRPIAPPLLLVLLTAVVTLAAGQAGDRPLVRAGAAPTSAALPRPPSRIPPTPTAAPLDEETVQRLTIFGFWPEEEPNVVLVGSRDTTLQVLPGATLALTLGVFECCYFFHPVSARAIWSIAPGDGARIDRTTGLLMIDPSTPSGSVFTVRADVEGGRRVVAVEAHVFTAEANPLVGFWLETAQLECETETEVIPEQPIDELVFGADGTFSVTWFPFEVYKDYWGTYTFDLTRGTLELVVTGGNYIPPDVDGRGQLAWDASGRLVLTELWLGTPPRDGTRPANCGHHFAH